MDFLTYGQGSTSLQRSFFQDSGGLVVMWAADPLESKGYLGRCLNQGLCRVS